MAARGAVERVALRGSTGTETFGGKRGPTHEERWIAPKDFPRAQQEVAWFFGSGESAMGAKGQAFAGGGSHVFDEDASARLHESMQSPKHRGDVDRYIRIWRTMRGIDKPVRDLLAVAYLAHAWDHILRTAFESKRFGVTLVGAVLVGELAATEYDTHCAKNEKAESRKLHGFAGMIAWLVDEVRPQVVKGIETHRRPKRFDLMQSEAESRVQAALSVYDDARRARVAAERKADADRIARLVGDMR